MAQQALGGAMQVGPNGMPMGMQLNQLSPQQIHQLRQAGRLPVCLYFIEKNVPLLPLTVSRCSTHSHRLSWPNKWHYSNSRATILRCKEDPRVSICR